MSDSPPDDLFDRPRLSHSPRRLSDRATTRKEILNVSLKAEERRLMDMQSFSTYSTKYRTQTRE